ncbi:protein rogdi homolog, partial [Cynoglossus semilaevis]|uniref:protein rogdi homolog n=1 Tax=Cynoglossus semilaevis TaxID=244447 RepID=UPI000D62D419
MIPVPRHHGMNMRDIMSNNHGLHFYQDINLKLAKSSQVLHFQFRDDKQWKLQQIQDAWNHVSQAIQMLNSRDETYNFKTGAEVIKLVDAVMLQLTRARGRLTTPASMTLTELGTSGLMVLRTHYTHWGLSLCPRALHPLATLFLTLFFIYINY